MVKHSDGVVCIAWSLDKEERNTTYCESVSTYHLPQGKYSRLGFRVICRWDLLAGELGQARFLTAEARRFLPKLGTVLRTMTSRFLADGSGTLISLSMAAFPPAFLLSFRVSFGASS